MDAVRRRSAGVASDQLSPRRQNNARRQSRPARMVSVNAEATTTPPPARSPRVAAYLIDGALVVLTLWVSTRFFAGLRHERVPTAFSNNGVRVCDMLGSDLGRPASMCRRIGDHVFYATTSHPLWRSLLPSLVVLVTNSVVFSRYLGGSVGSRAFSLRRSPGSTASTASNAESHTLRPSA